MNTARTRGYASPVRAGVGLGLVLLLVILVAGRGLGASGAFAVSSAAAIDLVAPARAAANGYLAQWVPTRSGVLGDWIVLELLAVAFGAWGSARLAGRRRSGVDIVAQESVRGRLLAAAAGGVLMGAGARLARGCTSGLGLTGGALLATGAWVFIPVAFGVAFLVATVRARTAEVASP